MALANGLGMPLVANLETFCYAKGISMFSNQSPTDMIVTETAQACWELCAVYEECKNWTFRSDGSGNKCLLITNDAAPVISEDSAAISGTHMCNLDSDCLMESVEFKGSDQDGGNAKFRKFTAEAAGCQWMCDMIEDCMLFDWNAETMECRLKNSGARAYVSETNTAGSHIC
ncbi:unnamed protein product [Oikopleura dioica]|uniref:Apple domain-containing protein n=1 Tax=Oikopleura dioica TaxID=34765 RepID=E4YGB1_OIKDI|nr:unnamed protein product [Oikopleura dioica]